MEFPEASAVWQWWNYAASRVPQGKEVLRINMDETSVCLFQSSAKGNVFCTKKRMRQFTKEPTAEEGADVVQPVSKTARRTCMTHVAFICDQTAVQPLLPQVVIGNCATFHVREWAQLNAQRPANVILVRQQSAWNNTERLKWILRLLGAALRPLAARYQPILLMDACRVHLPECVAQSCASLGIWLVIVPAKLTWLLQPCDTHAFLKYKTHLRSAYQELRAQSDTGEVSIGAFLSAVYSTIRFVLQGQKWALAFDRDGFGAGQAEVAPYVLRQLCWGAAPAVGAAVPDQATLELCYPKNASIPTARLLQPLAPVAPLALAGPAGPARPVAPPAVPVAPLALPTPRGLRLTPRPELMASPIRAQGPLTRGQSRLVAALAAGPGAASSSGGG